jgi:hypothetical protein
MTTRTMTEKRQKVLRGGCCRAGAGWAALGHGLSPRLSPGADLEDEDEEEDMPASQVKVRLRATVSFFMLG